MTIRKTHIYSCMYVFKENDTEPVVDYTRLAMERPKANCIETGVPQDRASILVTNTIEAAKAANFSKVIMWIPDEFTPADEAAAIYPSADMLKCLFAISMEADLRSRNSELSIPLMCVGSSPAMQPRRQHGWARGIHSHCRSAANRSSSKSRSQLWLRTGGFHHCWHQGLEVLPVPVTVMWQVSVSGGFRLGWL